MKNLITLLAVLILAALIISVAYGWIETFLTSFPKLRELFNILGYVLYIYLVFSLWKPVERVVRTMKIN